MATYIIERRGGKEYHVIEGAVLVYDEDQTGGDAKKKDQVAKVRERFKQIKDSPHTHYIAVEVSAGVTIMGGNTGDRP